MSNEIELKVAEAIQDDVNKGIVRIDSSLMHNLGIRSGDIVELEGERNSVAIVDRAYPGDIGLNIVRMDGIIRRNAKTGIGELVKVRAAKVESAKKVNIAPARKGIMVRAPVELFKQGLLGRAVIKGDIVALGGTKRRRRSMTDSPFEEIRKFYCRGGRGICGTKPVTWTPISEMSDDWLKASIKYNDDRDMGNSVANYMYCKEVKYRKRMNITIKD